MCVYLGIFITDNRWKIGERTVAVSDWKLGMSDEVPLPGHVHKSNRRLVKRKAQLESQCKVSQRNRDHRGAVQEHVTEREKRGKKRDAYANAEASQVQNDCLRLRTVNRRGLCQRTVHLFHSRGINATITISDPANIQCQAIYRFPISPSSDLLTNIFPISAISNDALIL